MTEKYFSAENSKFENREVGERIVQADQEHDINVRFVELYCVDAPTRDIA